MKLTLEFLASKRLITSHQHSPFVVVAWDRKCSFSMFTGDPTDLVELDYRFYDPIDDSDAFSFSDALLASADALLASRKNMLQYNGCNTTYSIPFVW